MLLVVQLLAFTGTGTATGVREGSFHTRDVPGVVVYALLFCVFSLLFQLG